MPMFRSAQPKVTLTHPVTAAPSLSMPLISHERIDKEYGAVEGAKQALGRQDVFVTMNVEPILFLFL